MLESTKKWMCRQCICWYCDLKDTDECLEGKNMCKKCDKESYTDECVYNDEE